MPHKKKRRASVTRKAKIVASISGLLAAALVFGGLYIKQQEILAANAAQAESYQPAPVQGVTEIPTTSVGILSDSHANNADSWWRQTIVADAVPGLTMGSFESQPGAETSSLIPRLDAATTDADMVVVQAGTNDLLSARTPEDAAQGLFSLWDGIKERGAQPIASLVPPSDARPAEVVVLNDLIREEAENQGIPLIDVYSTVANEDGAWAAGLSDDGVHSNKEGSDRMASAAQDQLAELR